MAAKRDQDEVSDKSRKRGQRRAHHKRMEKRTEKFECIQWVKEFYPDRFEHIVKRMSENRKPCSCYACRNPRRNPWAKGDKLTLQEKKILERDQKSVDIE